MEYVYKVKIVRTGRGTDKGFFKRGKLFANVHPEMTV